MNFRYQKLLLSLILFFLSTFSYSTTLTIKTFVGDLFKQAKENVTMQRIDSSAVCTTSNIFGGAFTCVRILESGTHAICVLAKQEDETQDKDVKEIVLKVANTRGKTDISDQELAAHLRLADLNTKYFLTVDPCFYEIAGRRVLAMEYCKLGDLLNFFLQKEYNCLYQAAILDLLIQALKAVQVLHEAPYIHRDIKAENFLLTAKGQLKLADFGYLVLAGDEDENGVFYGTIPYAAPESYDGVYNTKTDIFALGMTFLYLLQREYPLEEFREKLEGFFFGKESRSHKISNFFEEEYKPRMREAISFLKRKRLSLPEGSIDWVVNELQYFLYFMIYTSPGKRPEIRDILPYFVKIQKNIMNKEIPPEELAHYFAQE